MKFLFTCGGTAGHIYPALAIAGRLRELMPESEFLFVGAEGKMETELVPREGFEIETIRITNIQRKMTLSGIAHNLNTVKNLTVSLWEAGRIIDRFKPDVAVGTGGYVCYPVLRKAGNMGIPTVIHESNAIPGVTTKMLAGQASRVLVGFKDSRDSYKNRKNVVFTGTPVRGEFLKLTKDGARKDLGLDRHKPLVVSFWGSLGASNMNRIMEEFIRLSYRDKTMNLIHATGGGCEALAGMLKNLSERGIPCEKKYGIDIRDYIFDMPKVMAAADIVLCRAGASTLSELAAMGKPVILVPSPNVTNNHQEHNARVLQRSGAAVLIPESDCTGKGLYDRVIDLLRDAPKRKGMTMAMENLGMRDSTDKITSIILDLLKT